MDKTRALLQKIIGYDLWHVDTKRSYAIDTVYRINQLIINDEIGDGEIVEIGCGLGDIISSIKTPYKLGVDIDTKCIQGAKILHPFTKFICGSFGDIIDRNIAVLIILNVFHFIPPDKMYNSLNCLMENNEIRRVIVDEVQSPPYQYHYDFMSIMEKYGYGMEYKSQGYMAEGGSRRKVLHFLRGIN
ncbi:class I SAM-dependent methyltransferase [Butyrivibrio sp. AE2015]|uniref:class I SAM-dependent methyltransferase n=1 Tax=Butyrivibrio sp. AE2015 TaxID=1280663 RepID=UPI0003B72BCE|nr:class I SAM-dependent methyltransferase [Butyrivibrio sp. AE2015]